jgi:hypothetical protein
MAKTAIWSSDVLDEIVWALDITLKRVSIDELAGGPAAELWTQAHEWTREAQRIFAHPDTAHKCALVPRFPLTGEQLRQLQDAVEHAVQHRQTIPAATATAGQAVSSPLRSMSAPMLTKRAHSRITLHRAKQSSIELLVVLAIVAVLAILNVLSVIVWDQAPRSLFALLNLVGAAVALTIAGWHHGHLARHDHALHWLHQRS